MNRDDVNSGSACFLVHDHDATFLLREKDNVFLYFTIYLCNKKDVILKKK